MPLRPLIPILFSLTITSAALFLSSGRLDWPNAWTLLTLNFAASLAATLVTSRSPGLAAERRNIKAGKSWDRPIVAFVVLIGPLATWITAGLDTRFHWSRPLPPAAVITGIAIAILSAALIAWAMHTNRFFSSIVRIQKDRGHTVITSGPYRFVRHPAYTGMAAFTLVTPLILNSRWAFIPAAATAAVHVLRTLLEDRTLHTELEGYPAYASHVKFRLFPPF